MNRIALLLSVFIVLIVVVVVVAVMHVFQPAVPDVDTLVPNPPASAPVAATPAAVTPTGECKPVAPQVAARRALVLGALDLRRTREKRLRELSPPGAASSQAAAVYMQQKASIERLTDWLKDEKLWDSLSLTEKELFAARPGAWTQKDMDRTASALESAAVLEWALGKRSTLAPYDQSALTVPAGQAMPLEKSTAEYVNGSSLRGSDELRNTRSAAQWWWWRARVRQQTDAPGGYHGPDGQSADEMIAIALAKVAAAGVFRSIDNDFPAFSKPYRDLTTAQAARLYTIAQARLRALNWLCGEEADWDMLPSI